MRVFILFLVRFGLLSGHLFGKKLLTRLTICYICIFTICNLVIFRFGSKGWIWILIVSVPGLSGSIWEERANLSAVVYL